MAVKSEFRIESESVIIVNVAVMSEAQTFQFVLNSLEDVFL